VGSGEWKTAAAKVASHEIAIRSAILLWNRRPKSDARRRNEKHPARLECNILWGEGKSFRNFGGTFGPSFGEDEDDRA
jgi:hypothetical protein